MKFKKLEAEALSDVKYLHIIYERDLEISKNHQPTIDRVLSYIGLDPKPTETNFRKVNVYDQKEIITNYEEFRQTVNELEDL